MLGNIRRAIVAIALTASCAPVIHAQESAANRFRGSYYGVNLGGGWASPDVTTSTVFAPTGYFSATAVREIAAAGAQSLSKTGFTGGVQAGHNWQTGNFVAGIEADFNYFGTKASSSVTAPYTAAPPYRFTINSQVSTDWLLTARPRIGWAANNVLLYGTGGLAVTNINARWSFSDTFTAGVPSNAAESASTSTTKAGWVIGGGVEVAMASRWSLKLEYLHADFGTVSANGALSIVPGFGNAAVNPFSHSVNLQIDVVRAGFNYKLN